MALHDTDKAVEQKLSVEARSAPSPHPHTACQGRSVIDSLDPTQALTVRAEAAVAAGPPQQRAQVAGLVLHGCPGSCGGGTPAPQSPEGPQAAAGLPPPLPPEDAGLVSSSHQKLV